MTVLFYARLQGAIGAFLPARGWTPAIQRKYKHGKTPRVGNARGQVRMRRCAPASVARALACITAFAFAPMAAAPVVAAAGLTSPDVAAARFKPYVEDQIAHCLAAVVKMRERIAAQDLAGAQQAWLAARGGWERSEVISNVLFPDLDTAIDGWPNADRGFHAIEARLFGAHNAHVLPAADELLQNLQDFDRRVRAASFTAQDLVNGTARLAYEIGESKAGGGESPFSGNSLAEMGANVAAIQAVYGRVFVPELKKKDAALAQGAQQHLRQLQSLLTAATLADLDTTQLRKLSESVAVDLVSIAGDTGLQKPNLGN
jgi:iron uptake system component EfeO